MYCPADSRVHVSCQQDMACTVPAGRQFVNAETSVQRWCERARSLVNLVGAAALHKRAASTTIPRRHPQGYYPRSVEHTPDHRDRGAVGRGCVTVRGSVQYKNAYVGGADGTASWHCARSRWYPARAIATAQATLDRVRNTWEHEDSDEQRET